MAMRVLIAGGGVAALEAALALQALAEERVSVELLAPEPHFWYRPLSVAEPFGLGESHRFELAELAPTAGASFTLGELVGVDAERRVAHTSVGDLPYDVLLVACGAVPAVAVTGSLTFRGPADTDRMRRLLEEIGAGAVRRVAFVIPSGSAWSLPIYELALMTAAYARECKLYVELALVTPEEEPLQLFGDAASKAVRELLDESEIALHTATYPSEVVDGGLALVPEGGLAADRVVALPLLHGPRLDGLPQTRDGFIPVDEYGRVRDLEDLFAAGDITNFPVKQGGIAAQQADTVAAVIAASAGSDLDPQPFRPVLRGLLLTGGQPRYLRQEITRGVGETATISPEPLWWPPGKIVGRYLAPFLGTLAGVEVPAAPAEPPPAVEVEVELDFPVRRAAIDTGDRAGRSVADLMVPALVVEPEDTLAEVSEKMRAADIGSAAVAAYGHLVGILTSRDLLRAFAGRVHPSEARAREWMTAEPIAVSVKATVEDAYLLMAQHGIHHLPIVDGERPIGMLGFRQAAQARPARLGLGF
jgi:sulfide:quinone oxidoreductase